MSLLLLDTSVLIDAERSVAGLAGIVGDEDLPAIAAVSVAELGVGVSVARGRKQERRQAFFDDVVASIPILPYDLDVALAHRDLLVATRRSGVPRGALDLIIAATARAHGRLIVTADRAGFVDLPGVDVAE